VDRLNKIKILIADDEPNQLELIRFNLTKENFDVISASDGEEALCLSEEIFPDLIILDWMMPKMSGIDVCRKLRSKSVSRDIPIIILSARGEEGDRTLGLEIGADDYVTKPFSPMELLARIKAILRRSRPSLANDYMEFEKLRIYPSTQIVKYNGEKINLGPKEFKILSLLMERPEQIFSRTQILDKVWGHGIDVEQRTIDVYIRRIRKALMIDSNESKNIIRTVRGSGYALVTSKFGFH